MSKLPQDKTVQSALSPSDASGAGMSGASLSGSAVSSAPMSGAAVSGSGATTRRRGDREIFATDELAIVLSHYDIGFIEAIAEYPRGSRKAPKLLIQSDHGKYLLKRRARGKDDPFKVAFSHGLQMFLAGKQFPLPHLIGTKGENNSMLQLRGTVYELFEYISGQSYPQTLEATFDAGRILSLYHKLLLEFKSEWQPSSGSYHMAPSVEKGLRAIPQAIAQTPNGPAILKMLTFLLESYRYAAEVVENLGIDKWPRQIVHADWHPGNMLFRENHVVAVIDYDAARVLPRIVDIANGVLQFSILGGDDDVAKWPDYIDESRFKRFLRGYDEVMLLSHAEVSAIPWLMVEALIAEAVFPIAATGNFGRLEGLTFLQMVQRKIYWMTHHAPRLIELAEG